MFSRSPFNLPSAPPHISIWRRKNNRQIVAAKAVHGQAKGLGGATMLAFPFVDERTASGDAAQPARGDALEEPDRKRQNEKRELGRLDGVGRQLIAEKQKLK
jgi:hypothetical protein